MLFHVSRKNELDHGGPHHQIQLFIHLQHTYRTYLAINAAAEEFFELACYQMCVSACIITLTSSNSHRGTSCHECKHEPYVPYVTGAPCQTQSQGT